MRTLAAIALAGALAGCAGADPDDDLPVPAAGGPSSERQRARPVGEGGAPNGFHEYLPAGYHADGPERWPLLVFWHGIGENGNGSSELSRVLANGPPRLIARDLWPGERPFVVLSPQHAGGGCPGRDEVRGFLAWATSRYRVNARRVYLTGLSCGAIGAWDYLGSHAGEQVAAAVLIAGDPGNPASAGSAFGRAGCGLRELALWSLHGDADTVVGIANDRATMARLEACASPPGQELVWTELAGAGHGIWGGIYDGTTAPDVYAWMLRHRKP